MSSITNELDENIFVDAYETTNDNSENLELETPPPSPSDKKGEKPGLNFFKF